MEDRLIKVRHVKNDTAPETISEKEFKNLQTMKLADNLEYVGPADDFTPPESEVPASLRGSGKAKDKNTETTP